MYVHHPRCYCKYIKMPDIYRPQTKFAKVMFLHVSFILSTGGFPACIAGGIPECLAAGLGGWYPNMPCRFPGPHPRGSWGVWPVGGLQSHTWEGPALGGGCLLRGGWGCLLPQRCLLPRGVCGDPPCDSYCCRWYASYWNAFLFLLCVCVCVCARTCMRVCVCVYVSIILFNTGFCGHLPRTH